MSEIDLLSKNALIVEAYRLMIIALDDQDIVGKEIIIEDLEKLMYKYQKRAMRDFQKAIDKLAKQIMK